MTVKDLTERLLNCKWKVISHWHTGVEYPTSNVLNRKVLGIYVENNVVLISI